MLIPSGNNIARLLARWDAGSQQAFVAKMNRAARALGMDHTAYTGASGVEPSTTSTSADQLKLAQQAMRYEAFRAIVALPATTSPGVPGRLLNTNSLLGEDGVGQRDQRVGKVAQVTDVPPGPAVAGIRGDLDDVLVAEGTA